MPIVGRPLRDATGLVEVKNRARRDSRGAALCAAAANAWENDAQHECASVPAFLQLAQELLAHGAPAALVARALDAACDEISHAELCAKVASRLHGASVRPTLPPFSGRPVPSVSQLAAESWLDGCLGEGAAASRASRASRLAVDLRCKAAQARIARDERRHAELAWDILRWALDQGGPPAAEAVRTLEVHVPPAATSEGERLEHYGQLTAPAVESIFEQHAAWCVLRRDQMLVRRSQNSDSSGEASGGAPSEASAHGKVPQGV